ncbi:MAG: AMP-binding protein [Caulobacter sp.]|nr:AMP-binding protein [Caulobacter sp.]
MIDGTMQPFALTLDKFLQHAAKWRPDGQVVTARDDGTLDRIGYAGLEDRSRRVSTVLAGLGVGFGHRVATLAWNTRPHLEAWYAIMGMGAVCHTLNPRLTADTLAWMVGRSGARILIVAVDLLPLARQIAARAPTVERLLVIDAAEGDDRTVDGAGSPAVDNLATLVAGTAERLTWGHFDETSPCGLCFTSGTTGQPKGVTYTHRSSFLHAQRLLQVDAMAVSGADSVLAVVPMFHANAWGLPFAVPAAGGKLVLPGRHADGASLARLIKAEGVTTAVGVPTVWLGLLEHVEASGEQLPSLKRIVVGGAPMPEALMARLEDRLGARVQTTWGMTELSPSGTVTPLSDPVRPAGKSGRPIVGIDLLITDPEGRPLPSQRNAEGNLRVRGAAVVERYFGETETALDAEGWFDTGDLARIDDDGNLIITGRAKDLIKSGGEWINPVEIEAVVGALPQVSLAAVIGRTDAKWGERPILLVELRESGEVSDEALLAPLRGRVASWWIPDDVIRLPSMPLAATGKIDKIRLRTEYGGAPA